MLYGLKAINYVDKVRYIFSSKVTILTNIKKHSSNLHQAQFSFVAQTKQTKYGSLTYRSLYALVPFLCLPSKI